MKIISIILTLCMLNYKCIAQQSEQSNMNNTSYYHNSPQSFQSKLIKNIMRWFSMAEKMEKNIVNDSYRKKAIEIPTSIQRKYEVKVIEINGNKVWEISTKNKEPRANILYFHGGAYYANLTKQHWDFVNLLLKNTSARIIIPDYPLAPQFSYKEVYQFIEIVYKRLIDVYPTKDILLIGDSAGGGLSLGFAQKIKNDSIKQPKEIILLSPWLDISMSNPAILNYEKEDYLLSVNGLKIAGCKYARNLNVKNYKVSPIYGELSGLGRISIFIGTSELFIADVHKFKQLLEEQNISFNYFEYPNMFHDWVIITSLEESKDAINKLSKLLTAYN